MKRIIAVVATFILIAISADLLAQPKVGALSVQLVEPGWWPVLNKTVQLTKVTTCRQTGKPAGATASKETDNSYALFGNIEKGYYRVEVKQQGGFATKRECIQIYDFVPSFPTAYVQLKLPLEQLRERTHK